MKIHWNCFFFFFNHLLKGRHVPGLKIKRCKYKTNNRRIVLMSPRARFTTGVVNSYQSSSPLTTPHIDKEGQGCARPGLFLFIFDIYTLVYFVSIRELCFAFKINCVLPANPRAPRIAIKLECMCVLFPVALCIQYKGWGHYHLNNEGTKSTGLRHFIIKMRKCYFFQLSSIIMQFKYSRLSPAYNFVYVHAYIRSFKARWIIKWSSIVINYFVCSIRWFLHAVSILTWIYIIYYFTRNFKKKKILLKI